jgi:hypothetical protein
MMFRKPFHRLLDELPQVALPIQVVGTGMRILELERTIVVLPVLLDRLEQHERVAGAITQLVLGQV